MNKKVYIGNLPYSVSKDDLATRFEEFGAIASTYMPIDHQSGRPKGFAFVEFESSESAQRAIDELDGKDYEGRNIKVNFAREREEGGRGGRGGHGGRDQY